MTGAYPTVSADSDEGDVGALLGSRCSDWFE